MRLKSLKLNLILKIKLLHFAALKIKFGAFLGLPTLSKAAAKFKRVRLNERLKFKAIQGA